MEAVAIIPARYASTRLPGKPLADIHGKPMIVHVMERVSQLLTTYVATDDARIAQAVELAGGRAIMTSSSCVNGTARVAEALGQLTEKPDVVLNIQGDEPLVSMQDVDTLIRLMRRDEVRIGTLVTPAKPGDGDTMNNCFVDRTPDGLALNFARRPDCCSIQAWRHVGMYGFETALLPELIQLEPTEGEQRERLEQLRWHESGYPIYTAEVASAGIGVDSPEDLDIVRALMAPELKR